MLGELYRTFSDPRRRRLLVDLHEERPEAGLAVPTDGHVDGVGSDDGTADLRQHHLPVLERAGFVDWDPDAEQVLRGPRFHELEPFLELATRYGDHPRVDWPD